MGTTLRMRGIEKRFGATRALAGVDLELRAGEVHAIVGENGAGKSTLMKVLSGAHHPDSGHMEKDGAPYRPKNPADGRAAGVGMIYQELSLAPHLTVAENITLGVEPTRGPLVDHRTARRIAGAALARIGHPGLALDTPAGRLSPAGQQLVEIARAVASGCRVLVLDEPTSSLAHDDVERLFALVRSLAAEGHAIAYISHVLEEVREIADRFTVLRDGESVGGGDPKAVSDDDIVAMMVGRRVDELFPRSPRSPGDVVLTVTLPDSPPLEVRRGEIVGIAGLVGAGRTALARAIFGLERVARGEIRVAIGSGGRPSPARSWRDGVGFVSEDRKVEGLATGLGVSDNLALPKLPAWLSPRGIDRAALPWIERFPIRCAAPRQPVGSLSGGNQQKVAIARLLHADVDLLILDEPTRGIDVGSKAQIYRHIDERTARGKAVLWIGSYLPELLGVCDRIAVMARGRLGAARPATELDQHGLLLDATGATPATTEGPGGSRR